MPPPLSTSLVAIAALALGACIEPITDRGSSGGDTADVDPGVDGVLPDTGDGHATDGADGLPDTDSGSDGTSADTEPDGIEPDAGPCGALIEIVGAAPSAYLRDKPLDRPVELRLTQCGREVTDNPTFELWRQDGEAFWHRIDSAGGDAFSVTRLGAGVDLEGASAALAACGHSRTPAFPMEPRDELSADLGCLYFHASARSFVHLATGARHACVGLGAAELACWGDEQTGLDGEATLVPLPGEVGGLVDVALGGTESNTFSCLIEAGGQTLCAGSIAREDHAASIHDWVPVTELGEALRLAAGARHLCAGVRRDGGDAAPEVVCIGDNAWGQLGAESSAGSNVTIATFLGAMAAGRGHTCTWGPGGVVAMEGATDLCWGDNRKNQMGAGSAGSFPTSLPPTPFAESFASAFDERCPTLGRAFDELGAQTGTRLREALRVEAIAPGKEHTCAIARLALESQNTLPIAPLSAYLRDECDLDPSQNFILCAGDNSSLQRGEARGLTGVELLPPVNFVMRSYESGSSGPATKTAQGYRAIAAGDDFTCASRLDGVVECWGANDRGQLGRFHAGAPPTLHPNGTAPSHLAYEVDGIPWGHEITTLRAGKGYACAAAKERHEAPEDAHYLYCWGNWSFEQVTGPPLAFGARRLYPVAGH